MAQHPIYVQLESCLCSFNESCESFLVGYCDFSEHLTVEVNTSNLEAVHELGVVHTVNLSLSGDTSDPQSAEFSLLLLTADVCVVAGLHNGLLSHLEVLGLGTPVTLGSLQYLISSLARHHCALNSCHFILSFLNSYNLSSSRELVLTDQSLDVSSHCGAEDLAASEVSLSLSSLLAEVMTVVGMEYLYLAGTGNSKSLGRRLVCLDLSHFCISFQLVESGDFSWRISKSAVGDKTARIT